MFNKIIDLLRKRRIIKYAKHLGCDADGDILTYKGTKYFVYLFRGMVKKV